MSVTKAGLGAGLLGGTLDLAAAMTVYPAMYGLPVIRIPQSIASGVLGSRAYAGGVPAALLGVGLHFFIALVAGLVLAAAMARVAPLRRSVLGTGAGFGIAMYFFMQKVVLPLSQAALRAPDTTALAVGLAIHVLIFGIPMALLARRLLEP
jgi:hypothetical protein